MTIRSALANIAENTLATALVVLLVAFFAVYLFFDFKRMRGRRFRVATREPETPLQVMVPLVVSTLAFWAAFFLSPLVLLLGYYPPGGGNACITTPFNDALQILGLVSIALGVLLSDWSRWDRASVEANAAKHSEPKLATTGAYGIVRHPSYLGYFLMCGGTDNALDHYILG